MTCHIPTTRPACWTSKATPRTWTAVRPDAEARECRAWPSEKVRRDLQGDTCDGCARLGGRE